MVKLKSLANSRLGIFTFRHKIETVTLLRQMRNEKQEAIPSKEIRFRQAVAQH